MSPQEQETELPPALRRSLEVPPCCQAGLPPSRVSPHLGIQGGDLLLVGGGSQEIAHLSFQGIIHLHIDVVAGCLLLVIGVHAGRKQDIRGGTSAAFTLM